jgi:hypothetical protein
MKTTFVNIFYKMIFILVARIFLLSVTKVMCEFINLFRFLNYGVLLNSFVFVPADKAASNVNVVWSKYYGHIFKEEIVSSSTFKKSWLSIQPAKTATSHHWHIPTIYWYLNYMHSHSNFAWYQIRTNYIYCKVQVIKGDFFFFRTTPIITPNVGIMHLILYAIKTTSRLYKNILTG